MSDKWRVLIAEDDEDWQELAREALSKTNDYEVIFAGSLAEVGTLLHQKRTFDIALVDLGLGGYVNFNMQGGRDAAVRLQQETDAKVGLFSAITNEEARQIARELGVPLFDKTENDGFDNILKETLYWNLKVHREQE